jgi:hypothetical protein
MRMMASIFRAAFTSAPQIAYGLAAKNKGPHVGLRAVEKRQHAALKPATRRVVD